MELYVASAISMIWYDLYALAEVLEPLAIAPKPLCGRASELVDVVHDVAQ